MHLVRRLILLASFTPGLAAAEPSLAEQARTLFEAKRFPEARVVIEKIAAAEPNNAEAHYYLGALALIRNDPDAAVPELEQATSLAPTNAIYALQLGGAYGKAAQKAGLFSKFGLAKKALAALEKAVQLDPNNVDAHRGLMEYYRHAPSIAGGSLAKAREQAEAIRQRDRLAGAHAIATIDVQEKHFADALAAYEDGLKASPDNYYLLYSIGRVAGDSGEQLDRGEQSLHRCLELTPRDNEPPHAAVHWRLGLIAEKRGNPAAARKNYEDSLALNPGFQQAKESLAKLKS